MRTKIAAVLSAAAVLGSVAASGAHARPMRAGETSGAFGHRGRWITDARGRVVIVHGMNVVDKLPPYEPAALGFGRDDARFLARHGFDAVRLGFIYKGLEPTRGVYDDAYLNSIRRTARVLGRFGIRVLVDAHQDMYNERFNGEGFPDWAVQDDGLPAQPDGGFPANYFGMPALWRAFDHLWANDAVADGTGLQDDFAAAWEHVAERFAGEPEVLGYDTFNEPWPGSDWQSCLQPAGCPLFDATLTTFFTKLFAQIRKADAKHLVFYEPNPEMAGTGSDVYIGDTGDPNAGFSFHFYCLDALGFPGQFGSARCPAGEDRPFQVADGVSERNGDALLMSEFGATDDLDNVQLSVDLLDRHQMSWVYWAWWNRDPSSARPHEGIVRSPHRAPRGRNVKWAKLRVLVRPYPQAIAGTPIAWSFRHDRKSRRFTLAYRADPAIHAPTVIWVPRMHYPHGYRVKVSGPGRVTSHKNATHLTIRTTGGGRVRVRVRR
jgi:endoglycosylceramidase